MTVSKKNHDLSESERRVLGVIQHGMPMSLSPYRDLADRAGISAEQLLSTLREWKADGKIRRLGAIVNHFQMGHGTGAMVVWNVPEDRADEVGTLFAAFAKVSHAYRRPVKQDWPYNVYTMVHAGSADELEQTLDDMSRQSGITEFRALKTVRELKKVPPTYMINE